MNQTEQILAAVAAQFAKPVAPGPTLKVLRYEVLTWLGMVGGAITLTTNVSGLLKLSAALSWLLANWSALLKHFWHALLFFQVEVSPYDAELLTISLLLASAIFYSTTLRSSNPVQMATVPSQSRFSRALVISSLLFSLSLIFVILAIGTNDIAERQYEKEIKTWKRLVERVFAERPACAEALWAAYSKSGGSSWLGINGLSTGEDGQQKKLIDGCVDFGLRVVTDNSTITAKERSLYFDLPQFKAGDGVWGSFLSAGSLFPDVNILGVASIMSPILLPFVLYLMMKFIFPLELRIKVLSWRLLRTLILFGGVLLINFVGVNLEGWFKAISGEL